MIALLIVIGCGIAVVVLGALAIRDLRIARRKWAEAARDWERARRHWERTAEIYREISQRRTR